MLFLLQLLLAQRDQRHYTVYKKRRCFLWNHQYFQMDIYQQPCHPRYLLWAETKWFSKSAIKSIAILLWQLIIVARMTLSEIAAPEILTGVSVAPRIGGAFSQRRDCNRDAKNRHKMIECYYRCVGLILLETYTTAKGKDLTLPPFLDIAMEVTDDTSYSMYNLSKRDAATPKIEKLLTEPAKDDEVNNSGSINQTDSTKTTITPPVVNGTSWIRCYGVIHFI